MRCRMHTNPAPPVWSVHPLWLFVRTQKKTKNMKYSESVTKRQLFGRAAAFGAIATALFSSIEINAGQGPQPSICTRSCWGARAATSSHTQMSSLTRAVVHHTAGSGDWTTDYETAKARVRGVQNYHMDNNGWSDIGYHFLASAGGHIFEGRAGSMSSLPRGAHDGCNANSFGFTALGYFHSPYNQSYTTAMQNSVMDVIAWRMPSAWSPYGSGSYCSTDVGYLDGHRRVKATACPGDIIYNNYITDNRNGGPMRNGVNQRKNGNTTGRWYFSNDTEGWFSNWSMTSLAWEGCCGWTGVIYGDQTGDDSQIMSPGFGITGTVDASVNVQVYPQNGNTDAHDMQMFWKTDAENFWDAGKSSPTVTYTAKDKWIRLNMNVSSAKWSGQKVNQLRLDFDNINKGNRWLVNHVYTQQTPKYWFGSSDMGWVSGNGLTPVVWQSDSTWPGIIYADQTANDAFFYSPGISYLGGANDDIVIRVYPQNGTTANHDMKVYWTTAGDGTWSESKSSSTVYYTAQNSWAVITIPVGANPNWSSDFITKLRLDVDGTNTGVRWIIDYVAISHSTASKL